MLNSAAAPRAALVGWLRTKFPSLSAALKTAFVFGGGAFLTACVTIALFAKEQTPLAWMLPATLALVTAFASLPAVSVFRLHTRIESLVAGMAVVLASAIMTPVLGFAIAFQAFTPERLAWNLLALLLGGALTVPLGAALGWLAHKLVCEQPPN